MKPSEAEIQEMIKAMQEAKVPPLPNGSYIFKYKDKGKIKEVSVYPHPEKCRIKSSDDVDVFLGVSYQESK